MSGDTDAKNLRVLPLDRRPDLIGAADALIPRAWPPFMLEDDVAWSGWPELNRRFLSFQFVICSEDEQVIALGNTIPLTWDQTQAGLPAGFDGALVEGIAGHESGQPPNTLSALGATIDPWLRTHWRLGARILRVEPQSMVVTGSVAEWEQWAAMRFPETGRYDVPGALEPVTIDRENDLGRYVDPNVWMRHEITDLAS